MKFLEAKAQSGGENKMQPGSRPDQEGTGASAPLRVSNPPPTVRTDVKRLADELGVDLAEVTGTGRDRSITVTDVRKFASDRDENTGS